MDQICMTVGLRVAKRNIALEWRAIQVPCLSAWKKDMDWCKLAVMAIFERRGCPKKRAKIWGKWNDFPRWYMYNDCFY